jgi:hypothetical protein
MGGKRSSGPVCSVSPMAKAPGLVRPMTSPARAGGQGGWRGRGGEGLPGNRGAGGASSGVVLKGAGQQSQRQQGRGRGHERCGARSPAKPSCTVLRSLANIFWGAVSDTVLPVRATLTCGWRVVGAQGLEDIERQMSEQKAAWRASQRGHLDPQQQQLRTVIARPASPLVTGAACSCRVGPRTFMPFSNLPLKTRMKATLSLCLGSMLACSLNTSPLNWGLSGCTSPALVAAAAAGAGGARQRVEPPPLREALLLHRPAGQHTARWQRMQGTPPPCPRPSACHLPTHLACRQSL